jgi:putative redox protein
MAQVMTYYKGDMLFESKLGNHSVIIDVPAGMGGKDRAPTPPEFFIASLGSCVGAFVAQYCGRAGINTSDMTVSVTFDKLDNPTRMENIRIRVDLPYGECLDRMEAIRRVAEHCPVHETIATMQGVQFEIVGKEMAASPA